MKRAITSLLLATAACGAWAQSQQHKMKEDEPRTGSNLRRDAARASIPFNKPYEELSDAEKQGVRAVYVEMAPDDEPPYPRKGTARLYKALGEVMRSLRLDDNGMLDMSVMVDAEGTGTSVSIYSSPSPQLARAMAGVLMTEQYKPALCHGQPCAQEFPFRVKIERRY